LIGTTRENARSVEDYDAILHRLGMEPLPEVIGGNVLEIGTGRGNALPGLLALTRQRGHVVSLDIDRETLQRIPLERPDLGVTVHERGAPAQPPDAGPRVDVICSDATSVTLPPAYFDLAVSIWVFYQIKDKLAALRTVMAALRATGRFVAAAAGSVCTVPRSPGAEVVAKAREFVWNHRATRFSWLSGARELTSFFAEQGVAHRVESLSSLVGRKTRAKVELSRITPAEFPEGHFVLHNSKEALAGLEGLELASFVSTRNSAFVPIYVDPEFDGERP
jgi:SAM-dependent methyltransferase